MPYKQHLNFDFDEPAPVTNNSYSIASEIMKNLAGNQQNRAVQPMNQGPMATIFGNPDYQSRQNLQPSYQNRQQVNPEHDLIYKGGDTNPLMALLSKRESSNNPRAVNSLGYLGQFQMGAPLLSDLGLIKPEYAKMGNKALDMEEAWNIPGGKEAFLNNPELQHEVMQRAMALNRQRLEQAGLINEDTDPRIINGLLAASHLGGIGGAKKALQGRNIRDQYGTGVQDYFRMGYGA